MNTQQYAQAQISGPADSLHLVRDLVAQVGGQIVLEADSIERGGDMLKLLRIQANLKQQDIADALGVQQSHVSEFEANKRNIPYHHAQKLAKLLHSIPSHFMRPNAETLKAMHELEEGKGTESATAQELFENLGI